MQRAVLADGREHALQRRPEALERSLRHLGNGSSRSAPTATEKKTGFSPKSLASQRRRLGLSAEECGRLLGASSQSIYNWEEGEVRPGQRHMPAILALRTLGRRAAGAHLESLATSDGE